MLKKKKKENEPIETVELDNDGVPGALLQTFVTKSDLKQSIHNFIFSFMYYKYTSMYL